MRDRLLIIKAAEMLKDRSAPAEVREVVNELAPRQLLLLAQCREALEAAEVELATRTTMKRALGQVRAALLAITSSSA